MRIMDNEAFSGLETAIILIAFVVVGSVLSYTILGAGFFTAQKTEHIGYHTLEKTSSVLILPGDVHGIRRGDNIGEIRFSLTVATQDGSVPFESMVMVWQTDSVLRTLQPHNPLYCTSPDYGEWGIVSIQPSDAIGDTVLESGEKYTILANLSSGEELEPDEAFKLVLTSTSVMGFSINRVAPSKIDNMNILY